jgi:hypothetical protein
LDGGWKSAVFIVESIIYKDRTALIQIQTRSSLLCRFLMRAAIATMRVFVRWRGDAVVSECIA